MARFKHKKKLGQNFLKDNDIIKKIVSASTISKEDIVVEVGPGKGILTKELSKKAKQVIAFEIDESLSLDLKLNLAGLDNVEIIFKDFLEIEINGFLEKHKYEKLYFIANLPYYITTPIINKLINSAYNFDEIIVMVQKEVGERLVSKKGSKSYGSLSVYLDYYFEREYLFTVLRDKFIPSPNVDSCVIKLKRRKEKLKIKDEEFFFNLIKDSFRFKRKTLKNNLRGYDLEKIEEVLKKHKLDLSIRAEQLSVKVFADISNKLK